MCSRFFYPSGICITKNAFDQYSPDLKQAWKIFVSWWVDKIYETEGGPINPLDMPEDVLAAMNLIEKTPIPTYGGVIGAQSCLMINARKLLITPM